MKENQKFVYHKVRDNMTGSILYPLNILKETHPEIYKVHVKKYEGREDLLGQVIPFFDCLWNDVIHTTAVHPQETKDAMIEVGLTRLKDERQKYYKIPVEMLDPQKTIVCLYKEEFGEDMSYSEENFRLFRIEDIDEYSNLPDATKNFYRQCRKERRKFRSFVFIPHILHKGEIDVSNCEIIEV